MSNERSSRKLPAAPAVAQEPISGEFAKLVSNRERLLKLRARRGDTNQGPATREEVAQIAKQLGDQWELVLTHGTEAHTAQRADVLGMSLEELAALITDPTLQ